MITPLKQNIQAAPTTDSRPRKERRMEIIKQNKLIRKFRRKLGIDTIQYEASDSHLTSYAMMKEVHNFLKVIGFTDMFNSTVEFNQRKSFYSPQLISQLIIEQKTMGINRIENSDNLDSDNIYLRLHNLDRYPDPETIRNHLEKYDSARLSQLNNFNKKLMEKISSFLGPRYINLHFDSTVLTVFGDQEGAQKGYNPRYKGRKSYCLKTCTIEDLNLVVYIDLCPGDNVSATDFPLFFRNSINALPSNWVVKETKLDKGYFSEEVVKLMEDNCLEYTIAAKKHTPLKAHIKDQLEVSFDDVESERYKAVETFFRPDSWSAPRRFIIARVLDKRMKKNNQGELFPELYYREQALVTNKESSPIQTYYEYNQRAGCENINKELQYGFDLTKAPSLKYEANAAHAWLAIIGYNLILAMKLMVLPESWKNKTIASLRRLFIQIPGRLVNLAGKAIMKLSKRYKYILELNQIQINILLLGMKLAL